MKLLNFIFIFIFAVGFSQNHLAYAFPKVKSKVSVPVRIPLNEISTLVNSSLGNLIYEDDSYTDNNNDQFKVKVWKTRPIRLIGGTKQNIIIEVPLKIWAEKGIGKFGVYSYQNTTFETVMYFSTALDFKNNWTISPNTTSAGFKWVSKPVLDFGAVKIPITSLVEEKLIKQQKEFAKVIDEQMSKQLNFQSYAVTAWNLFAEPFQISEDYNTWLKITPIRVEIAPFVFYRDAIDTTIGIEVYSETMTGQKPATSILVNKVQNFNVVDSVVRDFRLKTMANIPYTVATKLAQDQFLNKEFDFREGKSRVKITDIKVLPKGERIILEAITEGTIEGTSIISGIPVYNPTKRRIVLTDTKFKLKTKNILHKTATVLFQKKIVKMIEDEYGIPTEELENTARISTEEAFNKSYNKSLIMNGKVSTLQPESIFLSTDGISLVIDLKAILFVQFKADL